jgi:hypothetical protein
MFTIFLDEDFAMKIAIPEVFEKTQHRYCQFHVTRTWKHELDKLYMTHKGLKTEPESLINYPLGPSGFEIAWKELVDRYSLHDHPAITSLWEKRKMWVLMHPSTPPVAATRVYLKGGGWRCGIGNEALILDDSRV